MTIRLAAWTPSIVAGLVALGFALVGERSAACADAAEPAGDEPLIREGVELRKEGHDAEALAAFERAYAERRSPRAAAQIALAHQALGHWVEAERALAGALADGDDAWIAAQRAPLQTSLDAIQAHLGWLRVGANVPRALVVIDGRAAGELPLDRPLRVVAGDLRLEVRAPGHAAVERRVHVEARSQTDEELTFVAAESSALPAPAPGDARGAGWIILGGAGVLALAGVGALVVRAREVAVYDDDGQCGPQGGVPRSQRCATNRDIGVAAQTVAVAVFAGAGVAALSAGVLFAMGTDQRPARSAAVACGAGGPLLLLCRGSF